jgi:phosphohistidine phosphatase
MRVLLVRHGDAEPALPGRGDSIRPLSPRGRREVELVAERLRAHEEHPTVVLASPLLRAAETAEIIARILDAPLETLDDLSTSGDPREVQRKVAQRPEETVVLVGHEPNMGELWALSAGSTRPDPFRKAEVRIVDDGREVFRGGPF